MSSSVVTELTSGGERSGGRLHLFQLKEVTEFCSRPSWNWNGVWEQVWKVEEIWLPQSNDWLHVLEGCEFGGGTIWIFVKLLLDVLFPFSRKFLCGWSQSGWPDHVFGYPIASILVVHGHKLQPWCLAGLCLWLPIASSRPALPGILPFGRIAAAKCSSQESVGWYGWTTCRIVHLGEAVLVQDQDMEDLNGKAVEPVLVVLKGKVGISTWCLHLVVLKWKIGVSTWCLDQMAAVLTVGGNQWSSFVLWRHEGSRLSPTPSYCKVKLTLFLLQEFLVSRKAVSSSHPGYERWRVLHIFQ